MLCSGVQREGSFGERSFVAVCVKQEGVCVVLAWHWRGWIYYLYVGYNTERQRMGLLELVLLQAGNSCNIPALMRFLMALMWSGILGASSAPCQKHFNWSLLKPPCPLVLLWVLCMESSRNPTFLAGKPQSSSCTWAGGVTPGAAAISGCRGKGHEQEG